MGDSYGGGGGGSGAASAHRGNDSDDDDDGEGGSDGGGGDSDESDLFVPVKKAGMQVAHAASRRAAGVAAVEEHIDEEDCAQWRSWAGAAVTRAPSALLGKWGEDTSRRALRAERFVTGGWGGKAAAARGGAEAGLGDSDNDTDGGEGGDWEDLEGQDEDFGGHGHEEDGDEGDEDDDNDDSDDEGAAADGGGGMAALRARAAADKAAAKAAFDAEYDSHKAQGVGVDGLDEGDEGGGGDGIVSAVSARAAEGVFEEAPEVKAVRARLLAQAAVNREEFAGLSDAARVRVTGVPPGSYVRLLITGVASEFVTRFHPRNPLLVGGLAPGEEGLALMRTRLKRHRWHAKILKTNDPLVFSVGWRRFQALPLFSMVDDNERQRFLKYTPEHLHCQATLWGPVTPPNTGFLAFKVRDGGRGLSHLTSHTPCTRPCALSHRTHLSYSPPSRRSQTTPPPSVSLQQVSCSRWMQAQR